MKSFCCSSGDFCEDENGRGNSNQLQREPKEAQESSQLNEDISPAASLSPSQEGRNGALDIKNKFILQFLLIFISMFYFWM